VSGCRTEIHRDHFPVDAEDVDWIPEIGRRGWILITKDSGILRKEKERQALLAGPVRAFIFKDKLLGRDVTIELINLLMPAMLRAIELYEAPFVYSMELPGSITPLSKLVAKTPV
jgi:hypothetical protein